MVSSINLKGQSQQFDLAKKDYGCMESSKEKNLWFLENFLMHLSFLIIIIFNNITLTCCTRDQNFVWDLRDSVTVISGIKPQFVFSWWLDFQRQYDTRITVLPFCLKITTYFIDRSKTILVRIQFLYPSSLAKLLVWFFKQEQRTETRILF
jgi:hypothetical protein